MGVSAAAAAFVVGAALAATVGKSKKPDIPATPTPQGDKVPDADADITKNAGTGQAGGSPGVAQTFLTGPGGVDPSLLNLGKSTLLGGTNG